MAAEITQSPYVVAYRMKKQGIRSHVYANAETAEREFKAYGAMPAVLEVSVTFHERGCIVGRLLHHFERPQP